MSLLCLLLQAMAPTVFPEAFGLDRHRIRLRAGATEKLRLSFLPFHLPPAHLPPGAEQPQAAGLLAPAPKSTIDSLLVLSDSECGEFTYAICGEVLPPAIFMEHKVKVGVEGTQVSCAAPRSVDWTRNDEGICTRYLRIASYVNGCILQLMTRCACRFWQRRSSLHIHVHHSHIITCAGRGSILLFYGARMKVHVYSCIGLPVRR